jgi:hypothetical protein
MDQAAPTFGLCLQCEADLSKRSTAWTGYHQKQQGVANQFQAMQLSQPAPPFVPENNSGAAWTGKRKPLCQKEATSTKGKGRPHAERPTKTVSQTKAVVKQPKEKPRNRAEILRRDEKTLLGYGVAKRLSNQGGYD